MAIYEVLDANGTRVNLIEWDGVTPYDPGEGLTLNVFVAQAPAEDQEPPEGALPLE